jgi:hypothetical protein
LENYREDTVVIFAGYKDSMKDFLNKNSGLSSRIPYHIDFPNYKPDELLEIIDVVLEEKNYTITPLTRKILQNEFRKIRLVEGNARDIRTIVEKSISEAVERLSLLDPSALTFDKLHTLEMNDFRPILRHQIKENRNKAAESFFGSPLFHVPATNTLKFTSRIIGSRLSGKQMTKKDILAMIPEMAVSIGTELAMHAIKKTSNGKNN